MFIGLTPPGDDLINISTTTIEIANPPSIEDGQLGIATNLPTIEGLDITGSLSGKRGQIEGMDERGMLRVIHAKVPLSEMFGYTTDIRSMTQGRGSIMMEFDHYEVVPANVEKTIVESRK